MSKLFFPLLMVIICSCNHSYVELFHAHAISPVIIQNEAYVFENDTVKITYSFWAQHGVMSFTVYNKMNIPIYVDWRKSAFIQNDDKQDYWHDVETVNSESTSRGVAASYYNVGVGKSVTTGTSVKTKPERVTFIAPHTQIEKSEFAIYNVAGVKLNPSEVKIYSAANTYKSDTTKKEDIAYRKFTQKESVLQFRNFLTFSFNENGNNEFYVDNGFYIGRIAVMRLNQFCGKKKVDVLAQETDYEYPYEDARLFYIYMSPEGNNYCAQLFDKRSQQKAANVLSGQ
jgi:hypothetical protein